jgi:predicted pyridoxine 5'-phosphate oxidase superfamily flavin-nucleotide-binding protein
MADVKEVLQEEWEKREGPAILTTVDSRGMPNAIYAGDMKYDPDIGFIVVDNYFSKTRENIKNGSLGSFLFITGEKKAYQAKGRLEYHTEGPIFDDMKQWHSQKHPGVAATVIKVDELYSGAEKLI